jgi:hypothetical protein
MLAEKPDKIRSTGEIQAVSHLVYIQVSVRKQSSGFEDKPVGDEVCERLS